MADDNVLQIWQPADMIINPSLSDQVDLNNVRSYVYWNKMYE